MHWLKYQHVYVDSIGSTEVMNSISNARCEDTGPWVCTGRNKLSDRVLLVLYGDDRVAFNLIKSNRVYVKRPL